MTPAAPTPPGYPPEDPRSKITFIPVHIQDPNEITCKVCAKTGVCVCYLTWPSTALH